MTTEIDIPLLSWLYQLLTGQPLTMLNAITGVIAIPATVLYRVIAGKTPRDGLSAQANSTGQRAEVGCAPASAGVQIFLQIVVGLVSIGSGIISGILDSTPGNSGVFINTADGKASFTAAGITLGFVAMAGGTSPIASETLAAGLFGAIPGIVNPIKLIGDYAMFAVSIIDVVCGYGLGIVNFILAAQIKSPAPLHRLHFPFVTFNPATVGAQPHPPAGAAP